jgi:uncharacterized membrane protein
VAESGRRLDVPRGSTRSLSGFLRLDPDAVGRFAEGIARFLGTGRFLAVQTLIVIVWITLNVVAVRLRWDPYPFILLNLAFSTQAAYAAPLILLAQNRQADRDRVALDEDRATSQRLQADVEYLAREVAALRQALGEVATREFLRDQLREAAEDVVARVGRPVEQEPEVERAARRERDERERRAEQRKRRAELPSGFDRVDDERPDLGEPFVGEAVEG